MDDFSDVTISRRNLLIAGALSATAVTLPVAANAQSASSASQPDTPAPSTAAVSLNINGQRHNLNVDTRTSLLDVLREHLQLTGTKKGCDHGQCGACTVMVGDRRINSCLTLAVMHNGDDITTIEGIGNKDRLHPMQAGFIKHDGYQCGYCTPGQICSAISVLREIKAGIPSLVSPDLTDAPTLTDAEIRERMSGNICRCGAYSNIVDAINDVAGSAA